jgi:uncharacterized protein (TIGR03435 family)
VIALHAVLAASALLALLAPVVAQTTTEDRPRFEAASVKPSASTDPGIGGTGGRAGRFDRRNAPALFYVEQAFGLPSTRIVGAPDWLRQERFDVVATYDQALGKAVPQMLQRLLEERFRLVSRREGRQVPVYELVRVREDGVLGPGLRPTSAECLPATGQPSPCRMRIAPGLFEGVGVAWQAVPINIGVWDRPVVDRTGLSGLFDMKLEWLPDPGLAGAPDAAARAAAAAADPAGRVSIFTALQEQLGLRLQPARVPLDVLVIERIERPTPD